MPSDAVGEEARERPVSTRIQLHRAAAWRKVGWMPPSALVAVRRAGNQRSHGIGISMARTAVG